MIYSTNVKVSFTCIICMLNLHCFGRQPNLLSERLKESFIMLNKMSPPTVVMR